MTAAGKRKALAWGLVALVLFVGALVAYTRPAPATIPTTELESRSAADARSIAAVVPPKYNERRFDLQGRGGLQPAIDNIAGETGVSAVRIWSKTGVLLASSVTNDPTSTPVGTSAIGAAVGSAARVTDVSGPGVVHVFEPVLPNRANAVVAEVVRSTKESSLPYKAIAAGLGLLGALSLVVALAGLFGKSEVTEEAGPPAAETPDVADEPVAPGSDRDYERLVRKLKTSEASRAAMETQLEQLRAQLKMGGLGSEQIVAELEGNLTSAQLRAHEAGEKLAAAESARVEAEERAAAAQEALSLATPSDVSARLADSQAQLEAAKRTIATLEASLSEQQARVRDAEARASEAAKPAPSVGDAGKATEIEARVREAEASVREAEASVSQAQARIAAAEERVRTSEAARSGAEGRAEAAEAARSLAEARAAEAEARASQAEARAAAAAVAPAVQEPPAPAAKAPPVPATKAPPVPVPKAPPVPAAVEAPPASEAAASTPTVTAAAPEPVAPAPDQIAEKVTGGKSAVTKLFQQASGLRREMPKAEPAQEFDVAALRSKFASVEDLSLSESAAPITPPLFPGSPPAGPETPSQRPTPPAAEAPTPPAAEEPAPSATDPGAWKALAKSLRRNALGDEAGDEPEGSAEPEEPTGPVSDAERSELRERLTRASARKRRKIE